MSSRNSRTSGVFPSAIPFMVVMMLCLVAFSISSRQRANNERARAQTIVWADKLDAQTKDTGTYDKMPNGNLPEIDPWGTPLQVTYSQGGVMEVIKVSSAGRDRKFGTKDDIVQLRQSTNLKGLGNGVKQNIEETTRNGAKGLASGLIEGGKEALHKK